MIRFGPAGIPLSCKGRTLLDGIEDVHNLSLSALEIQMVRPMTYSRPPDEDEEVGKGFRDVTEDFVISILRGEEIITDPDEPIEEDDELITLQGDIASNYGSLENIGNSAKWLDVNLSIHTPYYMDLGSETGLAMECVQSIQNAALVLNALGGDIVVTSLGIYGKGQDREEVDNNIYANVDYLTEWWKDCKLKPRFGVEITGQQEVFGSLDQVIDLCEEFRGCITPVVNFSHHHSRTNGTLLDADDFKGILEEVQPYSDGRIHTAFAGVEYADGDEKRLTPIKKGDLKFEPLADALIEMKPNATVISTSPLLEHDAMYMRIIHERVLTKKVAKMLKDKRKSESSE